MVSVKLRTIEDRDLESYLHLTHPNRKYHRYNGPYFKKKNEKEQEEYVENIRNLIRLGEKKPLGNGKIIVDSESDELIGELNWYWKSEETFWMEIGIVIFNEEYWNQGIGFNAFKLWIDEIFDSNKDLVRLGFTTWSGNTGMMRLGEKLGFKKEAVYRKARIVDGKYYDSISYGILREEWE